MTEDPQALMGPLFDRVPHDSRAALLRTLGAIKPDRDGPPRAFLGNPSWKVPLHWGNPLSPWEAEFVLRDILGCDDFGQAEKLAWEFALRFDGAPMTLAFQKFGMRAYIDKEQVDEEEAAVSMASRLALTIGRALPLLRRTVLSQIADEQIGGGQVNIDNHFRMLREQYEHFRDLSKASLLAASVAEPIREEHTGPWPSVSLRFPSIQLKSHAQYEANAALSAFFSMLEHLLLIEFLLSGREGGGGELAKFIASGWRAKLKSVVDLGDPYSKIQYDKLVAIHDDVRNRSIHGEVHSDGTDFNFILPGVGPVPAHLVTSGGTRSYQWRTADSSSLLDAVEEVRSWLDVGPLASAVTYGESGLPMFFGTGFRDELVEARDNPPALEATIETIIGMMDVAENMDW